eukprot:m.9104 g.9104  ORF g.9104 m.9104 type:complete len:511 (+) comp3364_c0_seq1:14-1546(+)
MQVVSRRRAVTHKSRKWTAVDKKKRDDSKYTTSLSFYSQPPTEDISLEEFEDLAVARLHVLRTCETARVRYPRGGDEFDKMIKKAAKEHLQWNAGEIHEDVLYDMRRRDYLSHCILRLAYCRTDDLRRWFLHQEKELFQWKLNSSKQLLQPFIELNNLHFDKVADEEKMHYRSELESVYYARSHQQMSDNVDFYKIPFEQALDLVRLRSAFVRSGVVYVAQDQLSTIVVGSFRMRLSKSLMRTSKALPTLEEDDRLLPMLKQLSEQNIGNDFKSKSSISGTVAPADIPQLAVESFPLCMSECQRALKESHHLKHGARMQYGLFLKGIGLSLEDALAFWKTEFTKSMSYEKFDKSYSYNIRHNYGKEGKRANYTPYNCMRIIMGNSPGVGDAHGCPFRHYNEGNLRTRLLANKIQRTDIDEVTDLVKMHHFQLACSRYFEITHPTAPKGSIAINHPNEYFEESRLLRTNKGSNDSMTTTTSATSISTNSAPTINEKDDDDDSHDVDMAERE